MVKKSYFLFLLAFCSFNCPNLCSAPITYSPTFTYNRAIPYRYVARVTTHKTFTNLYLDDGTVFRIDGVDSSREVCRWFINDPVIIYPNKSVFHGEDYYVYNERLNGYAYGNISCSPNAHDLSYLQIVEICYTNNVVTVVNGAQNRFYFEISPAHIHKVSSWLVQDCLVLGWNQDLWTGSDINYPYILINTNRNEYVNSEYVLY
jgi:hypothetical protein